MGPPRAYQRLLPRPPVPTTAAASHLAAEGAALAGVDSLNIDDTSGGERPVHSTLLAAGIPICEHFTNLAALPIYGFRFSAVPVKVRGMGTFFVRANATIQAGNRGYRARATIPPTPPAPGSDQHACSLACGVTMVIVGRRLWRAIVPERH